jgi:hypothetical protein
VNGECKGLCRFLSRRFWLRQANCVFIPKIHHSPFTIHNSQFARKL